MTVEQRSRNMAAVRGRGNASTELVLARLFRKNRITGWKRHAAVFGRPDFVFIKQKIAVFVDGCFWHGCKKHRSVPESNKKFWTGKLKQNRLRDRKVTIVLRKRGWRVIRVWEHELKSKNIEIPKKLVIKELIKY